MGSLSLLQGIFPTQGSNPGLPHWGRTLYQMSHLGSEEVGGGDQSQLHVTSQCCEGCLVPGCSQVPVRGQGACHPPPSSSLESSSSQPLTCGVPTVLFLLSLGRAGAVGRGILLTNAVLGFPSDMGSSGAILGKVGQLSPAPRPSIISLSSAAIQKTTALPVGAKGHFLRH